MFFKKKYLVYQPVTTKEKTIIENNKVDNYIDIDCIIRIVKAKNEQEALNNFKIYTSHIKVKRKLEPVVIKLSELANM